MTRFYANCSTTLDSKVFFTEKEAQEWCEKCNTDSPAGEGESDAYFLPEDDFIEDIILGNFDENSLVELYEFCDSYISCPAYDEKLFEKVVAQF